MENNIILREVNNIPLVINHDTLIYGLNGSGKTRILKLIYKYNLNGIQQIDLDDDMSIPNLKKTVKKDDESIKKTLELLHEEFGFIDSIIRQEYAVVIKASERRLFDRLYRYLKRLIGEGSILNISPFFMKDLKRLVQPGERHFYISYDNDEVIDDLLGTLVRRYIDKSLIFELEEYSNKKRSSSIKSQRKIKGEQRCYIIDVKKDTETIDEIIKNCQNNFSKNNNFNNVKYNGDIEFDNVFNFFSKLNYKLIKLNKELVKYLREGLYFDLDFDNWQWDLRTSNKDVYDIQKLSSGEKNILILLVALSFLETDVLIIDEPEISFSENYTMRFNESIEYLKSENMRLLIATHSYYIYKSFNGKKIELKFGDLSV